MAAPIVDDVHAAEIELPRGFDFPWVLGFLAARTVASLEAVTKREYRRSVRLDGKPVTLVIREVAAPSRDRPTRPSRRIPSTSSAPRPRG